MNLVWQGPKCCSNRLLVWPGPKWCRRHHFTASCASNFTQLGDLCQRCRKVLLHLASSYRWEKQYSALLSSIFLRLGYIYILVLYAYMYMLQIIFEIKQIFCLILKVAYFEIFKTMQFACLFSKLGKFAAYFQNYVTFNIFCITYRLISFCIFAWFDEI